jgi:putative protease
MFTSTQDIREFRSRPKERKCGGEIWLATPRIQKPAEMGIFRAMLKHRADGILVRNLAGLAFFTSQSVPVCADFSLNVANELTAFLIELAPAIDAFADLNAISCDLVAPFRRVAGSRR